MAPTHPNKHIEAALQYARSKGFRVEKAGPRAHPWGSIKCPAGSREGCMMSVWSTPKNPERHARAIRRWVDNCPHGLPEDGSPGEGSDRDGSDRKE